MKKLILFLAVIAASASCRAQVELFKRYADVKGVEQTYISKTMLALAGGFDKVFNKIELMRVLECDKRELIPQIKAEALAYYAKNGYEELLRQNDDGELTVIYQRPAKGKKQKKELCVLTVDNDEIEIVCIVGDITLEDIEKMSNLSEHTPYFQFPTDTVDGEQPPLG